jgi:hypothetical protein
MHGCGKWSVISRIWACLLLVVAGCSDAPRPASPVTPSVATDFDPAQAGNIQGQVMWEGEVPVVPAFEYRRNLPSGNAAEPRLVRENPNTPVIDAKSGGVAGAVVFLRGMEARHARPWDWPSVRVELRDRRLHIVQGNTDSRIGFVRQGQPVEMVSRESVFHSLHADGAAFFSLTFPDPDRPRQRSLDARGLVELSSAAGYYWMRAYLFVDEHPYYTRTDAQGRYQLTQVPPGQYQLVCWLPSWKVARHERDPETTVIARLYFGKPVEQERQVEVRTGSTTTVGFTVSSALFSR